MRGTAQVVMTSYAGGVGALVCVCLHVVVFTGTNM
jgi:hypothetical protein